MIFKYDNFKRFLIIIFYIFTVMIGSLFVLVDNWFAKVFGILIVFFSLRNIIDISLFKALIFQDNCIIKEWYFLGSKKICFENIKISVAKRIWTGIITFTDVNEVFFSRLVMAFEVFPIGNEGFREIREILISKKLIDKDDFNWN